jgi:hypothetical protein
LPWTLAVIVMVFNNNPNVPLHILWRKEVYLRRFSICQSSLTSSKDSLNLERAFSSLKEPSNQQKRGNGGGRGEDILWKGGLSNFWSKRFNKLEESRKIGQHKFFIFVNSLKLMCLFFPCF